MKDPNPVSTPALTSWLQNILNNCSDPALIADPSFRVIKWNTALDALLPAKNEYLRDRNILDVLEHLHYETTNFNEKLFELSNGAPVEEDILLRRSDGSTVTLSVHLHKLPGSNKVSAIVVIIRELRVQLEEQQTLQAFYKALADTIAEGTLLLKGDKGTVVTGNKKAWSILGVGEQSMLGRDILSMHWEIINENGLPILPEEYPAAVTLRTGAPIKGRVIGLRAPSGKITWLSVNSTPLKGFGHTHETYAVVTFCDITHEKQMEHKAWQNESLFYSYLNRSISHTWISNEDGQMIFINDLAREMWKIEDNYQLKSIEKLFPPEAAQFFIATDRQVLETREPLIFAVPFPRKDGTIGFYMVHKFLLNVSSAKSLIAGQAVDITEEKNAQEALRKSNERFSLIIKAISECVWDWDMESGQIFRSESLAALTGYSLEEMQKGLGWWYSKVHQSDRQRVKSKVDVCFQQGHEYWQDEYRFRCADKGYKYLLDKGVILYKDGKPVRAIGVIQDITEKKILEGKLLKQEIKKQKEISRAIIEAQDRERNELGRELHDNINQILCSAGLFLDCMQNDQQADKRALLEKSQQYLKMAVAEIRKLSKSLTTPVAREAGLIESVKEIISNLELSHQFVVTFDYDAVLEEQLASNLKLMIYRVIQEQTHNIVKYARATQVTIRIKREKNFICLSIVDNGQGFDLKKKSKGIGLANMRTRVETFNGFFGIHTAPGKGCHIKIMIPVKAAL